MFTRRCFEIRVRSLSALVSTYYICFALFRPCFILFLGKAPVRCCLLSLMWLNGWSVHGCFDDVVDSCIVMPAIAALVSRGADRDLRIPGETCTVVVPHLVHY